MASLSTLNDMLVKAAASIDDAMKAAASDKKALAPSFLQRLATAQVEIFEAQYHLWALDPSLLPDVLKGPAEDPSKAFQITMKRVRDAIEHNVPEVARGVLDIFIAYQVSPEYLARAQEERDRLRK